jgi:predicted component of type VI protein secretion system
MTDLIFVEQKPMEGREQTLDPGATIGREGCDVNLMDPEVSRRHAAIRDQSGSLAIEDLGSTNGTYVNGARISVVTVLNAGDEVRLGNTVWAIRSNAPAGAGATSVGSVPPPAAAAAPQVTAARAVPTDIQVPSSPPAPEPQATTAQQVPAAAASAAPPAPPAAPQQPAQPAAPSAAQVGRRGDVEAPPDVAPSAIRRVLPPPAQVQAPLFQPPGARPRGSAATRTDATIVCMIIVAVVAALLVIYFISKA